MIKLNLDSLNKLEQEIFKKLTNLLSENSKTSLSINEAAEICDVSTSKISKTIKKSGFKNYKDFIKFSLNEDTIQEKDYNTHNFQLERERIINFIKEFDYSIIKESADLILKYDKIAIYGLGPSFICAEYLEYKLRSFTPQMVFALNDKIQLNNILDKNTLLITLSTTGRFASFDDIISLAENKNSGIFMIFEEYCNDLYQNIKNKIFLTHNSQNSALEPYEKTRTLTFIFLEELLNEILLRKKDKF